MDKQIIRDIAADAAELGRALAAEGIQTRDAQAEIVAGAMPAIVAYETSVTRYGPDGDLEGAQLTPDPRIPGAAVPGER
jgi:hypothetical protein